MNKSSKILALVLAFVMTFAIAVPVFAAGDGSITVKNATAGKNYAAYKVLDATVNSEGDVAYFIMESSPWYDLVNNSGLFTLTATGTEGQYSVVKKPDATDAAIIGLFNGQFTYNNADGTFTCAVEATPEAKQENVADGEIVLDDIPYGYYFVTSSLGATITVDTTKPDVTIVDKNQEPDWDDDDDPNDTPDDPTDDIDRVGKEIVLADGTLSTTSTANYGDEVTFDIGIKATNFAKVEGKTELVTYYHITDTMDYGFEIPDDFILSVKVGDTVLTAVDSLDDVDGNKYYVSQKGNMFDIVIDWAQINSENDQLESLYANAVEIHVQYKAIVTEDAVIGAEGNDNTANFSYDTTKDDPSTPDVNEGYDPENPPEEDPKPSNPDNTPTIPNPAYDPDVPPTKPNESFDPNQPEDPETNPKEVPNPEYKPPEIDNPKYEPPTIPNENFDPNKPEDPETNPKEFPNPNYDPTPEYDDDNEVTTTTYVYAIGLSKVDEEGNALAGAQFKAKDIKLTGADGVYSYDAENGTAELVLDCDADGKLVIMGLAAGTYVLNETKAPDAYNINTEDITFTVTEGAADTAGYEEPVAFSKTFENNKGTELPQTGGIGSKIFIGIGLLAVVGAGIFLVTNKRISKEEI